MRVIKYYDGEHGVGVQLSMPEEIFNQLYQKVKEVVDPEQVVVFNDELRKQAKKLVEYTVNKEEKKV